MYEPHRLLCFFLLTISPCLSRDIRSETIEPENTYNRTSLAELSTLDMSNLELALEAIKNLTETQKQVLEQQREHELQVRTKNREDEEREKARLEALEKEQLLLKEIRGKIGRKMKAMSRRQTNYNRNDQGAADPQEIRPKDCADIYLGAEDASGVYRVWPIRAQDVNGVLVYCDMDTDGGGWTVIHRWISNGFPSDYFSRPWYEYKQGFGELTSAFWLGNERIYQLTTQGSYELRITFVDQNVKTYSKYSNFRIEGEPTKYKLHVGSFDSRGTAGDVFSSHNGRVFSTMDLNYKEGYIWNGIQYVRDDHNNFEGTASECASSKRRAWWFETDCFLHKKLNPSVSIYQINVEMSIRPVLFSQHKENY